MMTTYDFALATAVLLAFLDVVKSLGLDLVAQEIDAVVETPELAGARFPIESNGVAQAVGEDGPALAIGRGAQDGRVLWVRVVASVACRTSADVQHAIRSERQRAVGMLTGVWKVADEHLQRT